MHRPTPRRRAAAALAALALAGCGKAESRGLTAATGAAPNTAPGTAAAPGDVANPAVLARGAAWLPPGTRDGEWTTAARDYGSTRFSPLAEITTQNVATLKVAFTFSDGVPRGHEGTPLVAGNTMYVVSPFPDVAYALDLTKPGAPIKWKYTPNPAPIAIGKNCCDGVLRGWALADGKLIYNLLDAHTVAVDTATGKEVWRTKLGDVENGLTLTGPPLVVKGQVLVGNSVGEMGGQGWLTALDVKTGQVAWRAYSVGPDSMTRVGPDFKPFYPQFRGKDLGATTWAGDSWRHGGGATWAWTSYDPDLDLIYYGIGNPSPWNGAQRAGANLWTSAVVARHAGDGMARWAFQFTPHNDWDYDGVNEDILVDLPMDGPGRPLRKVLVHFNRNAFAYTIDRATGEVLVAKPFAHLNWATGIDPKTMTPIVNPDKNPEPPGRWVRDICPADIGGKDFPPAAYSPRTGLFYVPAENVCMDYYTRQVSYIAGTPYWGAWSKHHAGPGGFTGELIAWDAVHGRKLWGVPEQFLIWSGALATAGDLVFYGTADGWFRALDARTGKVLWSQKLSSGVEGAPMTYRGPDGHQYVAVATGVGSAAMIQEGMKGFPPRGSTLYVFTLGTTPTEGPPPAVVAGDAANAVPNGANGAPHAAGHGP